MTLVEFIKARVDEDEQAASAATSGPWRIDSEIHPEAIYSENDYATCVIGGGRWGGEGSVFESDEDARHIARHDPARVLREVAAKRAIMEIHHAKDSWGTCLGCGFDNEGSLFMDVDECPILRILALPYSDHPDFREEWAL